MSDRPVSFFQHASALMRLALPLIASQVAQFAIGLTDAIMLGWYSLEAFAAQVLGGSFFFIFLLFGSGFAFALSPVVATAAAQDDQIQIRRSTRMSFWLVAMFAVLALPFLLFSEPILLLAGQEPQLAADADSYLKIMGISILPALFVMVTRSYLSSLEQAAIILYVTLGSVALNAGINYLLIFGSFGFPELGLRGAAIASLGVNTFTFVFLAIYAVWKNPEHELFMRFWRPDWEALREIFSLGWPIGITVLAEVGLFTASSIMVGWVGVVELGAHGIALQIASLTFMFHLGLSQAVTVRAGGNVGRSDWAAVRQVAKVALSISIGFSLFAISMFLLFPEALLKIFVSPSEPNLDELLRHGVILLYLAAIFQLADGIQVIGTSLLRGLKDTRIPMVFATISYWGIGMTTAYTLGFIFDLGAAGVWWGLVTGLSASAVLMLTRFRLLLRQHPKT